MDNPNERLVDETHSADQTHSIDQQENVSVTEIGGLPVSPAISNTVSVEQFLIDLHNITNKNDQAYVARLIVALGTPEQILSALRIRGLHKDAQKVLTGGIAKMGTIEQIMQVFEDYWYLAELLQGIIEKGSVEHMAVAIVRCPSYGLSRRIVELGTPEQILLALRNISGQKGLDIEGVKIALTKGIIAGNGNNQQILEAYECCSKTVELCGNCLPDISSRIVGKRDSELITGAYDLLTNNVSHNESREVLAKGIAEYCTVEQVISYLDNLKKGKVLLELINGIAKRGNPDEILLALTHQSVAGSTKKYSLEAQVILARGLVKKGAPKNIIIAAIDAVFCDGNGRALVSLVSGIVQELTPDEIFKIYDKLQSSHPGENTVKSMLTSRLGKVGTIQQIIITLDGIGLSNLGDYGASGGLARGIVEKGTVNEILTTLQKYPLLTLARGIVEKGTPENMLHALGFSYQGNDGFATDVQTILSHGIYTKGTPEQISLALEIVKYNGSAIKALNGQRFNFKTDNGLR